jgi:hypothetical protein
MVGNVSSSRNSGIAETPPFAIPADPVAGAIGAVWARGDAGKSQRIGISSYASLSSTFILTIRKEIKIFEKPLAECPPF